MTLLKEYAVEPACLGIDPRTAAQVLGLFGSERGRVVTTCPRTWLEEAVQALDRWPDAHRHAVKRKEMVERLRRLEQVGIFPGRQAWIGGRAWPEAAMIEHHVRPFVGVLATEARDAERWITVPDDLDPDGVPLEAAHEIRVERSAAAMADALAPVLSVSRTVLFVDPHFSPDARRFLSTLGAWLGAVGAARRLEYHLLGARRDGETVFDPAWFRQKLEQRCRFVPAHLTLSFMQWRERFEGEQFHARYIITERAAVRLDNGLDEGRAGETVSLTLLPYQEHQRWLRAYGEASDTFELLSPIYEVSNGGYVEEREPEVG